MATGDPSEDPALHWIVSGKASTIVSGRSDCKITCSWRRRPTNLHRRNQPAVTQRTIVRSARPTPRSDADGYTGIYDGERHYGAPAEQLPSVKGRGARITDAPE